MCLEILISWPEKSSKVLIFQFTIRECYKQNCQWFTRTHMKPLSLNIHYMTWFLVTAFSFCRYPYNKRHLKITWMSNIEAGLILTPYSFWRNWTSFNLFSCFTVWILLWKPGSSTNCFNSCNCSKWTVQLSPIFWKWNESNSRLCKSSGNSIAIWFEHRKI